MEKDKKISLVARIFRILESSNQGFFPALAKAKDGMISVFYEEANERITFFKLNLTEKRINFYESPKCYLTEQECIKLVSDLKEKDYKIEGDSFSENPRYKPNETSLY